MKKMLCSRLAKGTFSSLCRAPFSQAQHYFRNKAIRGGASLRWCSSPLPPGWEKMFTPDGIPYYVDHNTKTSQWASPMANQAAHNHLEGEWAFCMGGGAAGSLAVGLKKARVCFASMTCGKGTGDKKVY